MTNDKHNRAPDPLWSAEVLADVESTISDEELMLVKTGFLKSVAKAEQQEVGRKRKLQLISNLAKVAAALLVVFGLGWVTRFAVEPEVVIAGRLDDFTAVVISDFTNKVVPGVEVYRVGTGDASGQNELVGTTNSNGIITLAIPGGQVSSQFEFMFDGKKVGSVNLGDQESNARGIYRVGTNIKPDELAKTIPVYLEPGNWVVIGSFKISLDNASAESWEGSVTLDRAWPAIFNYGDVLDGIISVDGPKNKWLTLVYGFPKASDSEQSALKLVSHDAIYEKSKPGWKSRFHRGWYNTGNPPREYLSLEEFSFTTNGGDSLFEWQPRSGAQYVIMKIAPNDGEVAACYKQVLSGSGLLYQQRSLEFINQKRPGIWLYEWLYFPPSGASPYYFPEYYHKSHQSQGLESELRPRGSIDGGYRWPPFIVEDERRLLPGEFSVNRYDFTVCDPVEFPRIKADYTEPAGTYHLEIDKGEVGEISKIKLRGQLGRIAQPVEWDIDTDLVTDSFGNEIELLIPSYGSYHISAQIKEKCGNDVLIKTKLNYSSDDVVGYLPSLVTDYPVVRGLDAPIEKTDSLWVMSAYSTSNLQAHSYSIGSFAGPLMYVKPPEDFVNVPLKEARLISYMSPRSGDYESLPLSFIFQPVTLVQDSEFPFVLDKSFSPFLESHSTLSAHSTSWISRQALQAHYDESTEQNAKDLLEAWQSHPTFYNCVDRYIGLDLFDLPEENELVEKLENFQNSPEFDVHYVTEEFQEITLRLPLPDGNFGVDTGFYTGIQLETLNLLLTAQWEIYSGEEYPTRVEIETLDGRVYTQYFDYSRDY